MYKIKVYETPAGSCPLKKYLRRLTNDHKDENITQIRAMIDGLKEYGFDLNKIIKNALKPVGNQIYELRPKPTRIFFFYFDNGEFILLHGFEKKTQKTPKKEIRKAEAEKADYIKRYKQ